MLPLFKIHKNNFNSYIHKTCLRGNFDYLLFFPYELSLEQRAYIGHNLIVIQTILGYVEWG